MDIIVEFLSKEYKYNVNSSYYVEDIKLKIQDEEGIPIEYQNLYLKDQLLENNHSITHYNINNNSILQLIVRPNTIIIFIKLTNGKFLNIKAETSQKIEYIKYEINKKENIPINSQMLTFKNKILNDKNTIEYYNITNSSIIELNKYYLINIYIKLLSGRRFCINTIGELPSIKDIKNKIQQKINIPIGEQQLYFNDKLLDNNKNLDYYKINSGSIIDLFINSIIIFVKNLSGKKVIYEVKLTDTIKELKMKIEQKEGIETYNQLLEYNSERLENTKTLSDYNIQNEYSLALFYKSKGGINIFIINNNKNIMTLDVDPNDKIDNIKDIIYEQKWIIFNYNSLKFGGNILHQGNTFADYNIQNNSNIFAL